MTDTALRTYGGVTGSDRQTERRNRLIAAGLELLGSQGGEQHLSVRGVCRHAGLTTRYFYESFTDRDALASTVYEQVVREIADTTWEAVNQAPERVDAKVRAGLTCLIRMIAADPRRGRLLFSPALNNTVLATQRIESTRLFVGLLGVQAREFYGVEESTRLDIVAEMLVGGLAQTLTSWLNGTLPADEDAIVEHCAGVFLAAAAAL